MAKVEVNVLELLEFLQDTVDNAPKVPMSGKVMVDKKEIHDTIDEILNYFPEAIKRARWVMEEKDRILAEAKQDLNLAKEESVQLKIANVENHDIVRDAKIRAQEIIVAAKREAKTIRIGSRDYSDEILSDIDREIEKKKIELIKGLQASFTRAATEIDDNLTGACSTIKENIKELRTFK